MFHSRGSNPISLEKAGSGLFTPGGRASCQDQSYKHCWFQTRNVLAALASMAWLRVRHDAAVLGVHARLSSPLTTVNTILHPASVEHQADC